MTFMIFICLLTIFMISVIALALAELVPWIETDNETIYCYLWPQIKRDVKNENCLTPARVILSVFAIICAVFFIPLANLVKLQT